LDFGSLQHTKVRKSTIREVSTPHYVPPSGFGYPLDGLLLPSPCRVCFAPTALLGFTLRSFPLSKGIRDVTARKHPPAVFLADTLAAEANDPSRQAAAPGLSPFRESLAIRGVFSTPGRRMLPWVFALPGHTREGLESGPLPISSHALFPAAPGGESRTAPQSIDRLSLGLVHERRRIQSWARQPS
jgi:hypothetical protein